MVATSLTKLDPEHPVILLKLVNHALDRIQGAGWLVVGHGHFLGLGEFASWRIEQADVHSDVSESRIDDPAHLLNCGLICVVLALSIPTVLRWCGDDPLTHRMRETHEINILPVAERTKLLERIISRQLGMIQHGFQ